LDTREDEPFVKQRKIKIIITHVMNIKLKEVVAGTGVLDTLEGILKEKMLNFSKRFQWIFSGVLNYF